MEWSGWKSKHHQLINFCVHPDRLDWLFTTAAAVLGFTMHPQRRLHSIIGEGLSIKSSDDCKQRKNALPPGSLPRGLMMWEMKWVGFCSGKEAFFLLYRLFKSWICFEKILWFQGNESNFIANGQSIELFFCLL